MLKIYLQKNILQDRSIEQTNIPTNVKNAAKKVYRGVANSMNSNFPKQSFVNYVINGFSNGVDTELVKLVGQSRGGEMYMVGGKTLKIDDNFRQLMMSLDYSAEYKGTVKSAIIVIKAKGVSDPILQFRYKWENKSNKPTADTPGKTYSMYPRHYF